MSGEKYSAVVMAGGFGSRLAPLTNTRPKPMLPVNNRSAFERILDLLADNGFSGAAVTTMYLPEQLESVKHDRISLSFFRETEPKGSAGAVRALSDSLCDTVLIISGDAVCDFELKMYYDKHVSENRKATMLLTKTKNPKEFGTVLLDGKTGRITRFLEKPSWADTVSNLINTGIYILGKDIINMIPDGAFFDFGRDLFPLLMKKNIPIYGEQASGNWCDIGTFGDYYGCSMRLSGEKSIIGEGSSIDKDAKIIGSILFENVKVGVSEVTDSIIGENVVVGNGCVIPEGCVIGAGSVIGDRAVLSPGVKIADHIRIGKGAKVMGNIFMSSSPRHLFGDEGIFGKYGSEIDGELCFKLGQGVTTLGKPARIGVMNNGGEISRLLADSVKIGAVSCGGQVIDLEDGFVEVASFAPQEYNLDCCIYVAYLGAESDKNVLIRLYEKTGLFLSREKQRKIENAMREKLPVPTEIFKPQVLEHAQRVKFRYCHYLQAATGRLDGVQAAALGTNEQANFFFSNARELGAETALLKDESDMSGDIFIFDGDSSVSAIADDGTTLSFWQLFTLAALSGDKNKELYLPQVTPEAVEGFLNDSGCAAVFYNDNDSEERKKAFSTHFFGDSVLLALLVCRYLRENNITLKEAVNKLPRFFVRSVDIDIDDDEKADLIGSLAEECGDCSRGVRLRNEKGSIAVFPREEGGFRVLAEAASSEFAEELCSFAENKLKKT
jgi:mannose-1-phosphate guanylyltransferase/phosphomannomutase